MARKILILADDEDVLRQAADALVAWEGELATERSAPAALRRLLAGEADLVVVDADLPGGEGLRFTSDLRRQAGAFPFVLLASPERQATLSETVAAVAKPVRGDLLRQAVVRALAPPPGVLTPGPALHGPGGSLAQRPLHVVLGELARRGATGRLELQAGSWRARILLADGWVTAAVASPPRAAGAPVVEAACGLSAGSWSFVEEPAARVATEWLHPLALAVAGVRRAYPASIARGWLERHGAERAVAHPALGTSLHEAGLESGLPAALAAAPDTGALLARLSEEEVVLLFALAGFGLVGFAPPRAGAGPSIDPALARTIEVEARRTADATHYEVLGVERLSSPDEIKRAYFALAKRWHIDAFAGRELGERAQLVEQLFARIAEAYAVLADPAKRAEYDVFLERKAKGLPTDVASVLQAEETFHKAQALFRAQRYADAEALFRQAVDRNPAEAEFWAYLGASSYRARGAAAVQESREAFARARALIPESLVTEYLEAQLEIGEGELDAAERRLRKILLAKPDHREASRDLRTLRERKERESATGRGFLGTLWKRK